MDAEVIKELASLPAVAILVVVIILQQRQIEKLIDSIIRFQNETSRNFTVLVTGCRGVLPDMVDPVESAQTH